MLKQFRNTFKLRFCSLWQMCAIFTGIWAAFYIFLGLMVKFKSPDTYSNMAVILALAFGMMFLVLTFAMSYCVDFELAVKMSVPRKRYLIEGIISDVIICVSVALLMIILMYVDKLLTSLFFGNVKNDELFIYPTIKTFGLLLLVCVGALVIGMFIGTLLQKFGKAAFWVLWGLYMVVALCGMGVGIASENSNSFIGKAAAAITKFTSTLTSTHYTILGIAAALIIVVTSVIMLCRASIKS